MIRNLKEKDIPEVAKFVFEALSKEFEKVGEGKSLLEECINDIEFGLRNNWMWYVFEDRSIVGYSSCNIEEGQGYINTIVVKKGWRKRYRLCPDNKNSQRTDHLDNSDPLILTTFKY